MNVAVNSRISSRPNIWADRSEYWRAELNSGTKKRKRRERNAESLIIGGHGASLRIEKGTLLIKGGFTHYPQQREDYRYFRGDLNLPTRIIVLDGSGYITFEVLDWLSEQNCQLIRINWDGSVNCVIGGCNYSANTEKVIWQTKTRADEKPRLKYALGIITKKLENSRETLINFVPRLNFYESGLKSLEASISQLKDKPPSNVSELLGIEGPAASGYFRAWRGLELNWKATKQFPIPEDWRVFTSRASLNAKEAANINASHPLNAMLNYAYAVLFAELHIKAVSEGYDPTIGIIHDRQVRNRRRPSAFVLDEMEPLRPIVDAAILQLVSNTTFSGADFVLRKDGVCRLNPQLARKVVQVVRRKYGLTSCSDTRSTR